MAYLGRKGASAPLTIADLPSTATTDVELLAVKQDLTTLALRQAMGDNNVAYNLSNAFIDQFESGSGIQSETLGHRNVAEYWSSKSSGNTASATTNLILHFDNNTNDSSTITQNPTHTSSAPGFVTNLFGLF
jgi:hypothetical protein